jgi:hypothetical protein
MKHIVMAAVMVLCITAGISFAAENPDSEKDWCLLGISNKCAGSTTLDLVEKIKRLNIAINKGTAVYSPEELEHFKKKLEDAYEAEDFLVKRR